MSRQLNIVLTGASAGIGAALTSALAADGHRLFVCARREDKLRKVTEDARIAAPFVCDVGSREDVEGFFAGVSQSIKTLDVLINCAGAFGAIGNVADVDPEAWWDTVKDNLFGTFMVTRTFLPLMPDGARIINFSGGGSFNAFPRYSGYAVSKAAVVRLSETLAIELEARRIAVNAVAPGFVATEIHDATLAVGPERAGSDFYETTMSKIKDGAVPISRPVDLVRYLISERSAGLTGKTISASFDPWDKPEFSAGIAELNRSDLYTMRRIDLRHLKD